MISARTFELAIVFGGALLALWIVVRFPKLAPSRLWTAVAHIVVAYFVGSAMLAVAPAFLCGIVPREAIAAAIVCSTLPPVAYLFTTIAWFILNVQRLAAAPR